MNGTVMVIELRSGRVNSPTAGAEGLDDAEQVVPAAGVQPRGVVAELVEDLLHLERSGVGLDQAGGADGPPRDVQLVLREVERVVPEAGLEVALHLRQVEVRALPAVDLLLPAADQVQGEVDEAARGLLAVHGDVLLRQVPAPRADDDRRE